MMKRAIPGLVLFLVLGASAAWSSPLCTDQSAGGVGGNTMANYVALGSGGCILNGLLFNNFSYNYTIGPGSTYPGSGPVGTGANQAASSVVVAVSTADTSFMFLANWFVNHYQSASLSLSYNVSAPSGTIGSLQDSLTTTQSGTDNGGPSSAMQALCTGGTCGPTDFTNQTVAISSTPGPLLITNTFAMDAKGGSISSTNNVHLSIITNAFGAASVPEPGTYAMIGAGLATLAFLRKRR